MPLTKILFTLSCHLFLSLFPSLSSQHDINVFLDPVLVVWFIMCLLGGLSVEWEKERKQNKDETKQVIKIYF